MLQFKTTSFWSEDLWNKAKIVYEEAFGRHNGKNTAVIQNMFTKKMCALHVVLDDLDTESKVIGMAITGKLNAINSLLIDYVAINKTHRSKGIGFQFVTYLKEYALSELNCDGIVLEVEATDTPIHSQRIKFWEKCGFQLMDYIHDYKVVPEPYQAMYQKLTPTAIEIIDGKEIFKLLSQFHQKSFRSVTKTD